MSDLMSWELELPLEYKAMVSRFDLFRFTAECACTYSYHHNRHETVLDLTTNQLVE